MCGAVQRLTAKCRLAVIRGPEGIMIDRTVPHKVESSPQADIERPQLDADRAPFEHVRSELSRRCSRHVSRTAAPGETA